MATVALSGSFDDLRSRHIRLLQEAARHGAVQVQLWPDDMVAAVDGKAPKFPAAERQYFVESLRYVKGVTIIPGPGNPDALSPGEPRPDIWVVPQAADNPAKRAFAAAQGLQYQVITDEQLQGYPLPEITSSPAGRPKVIVTGCYDWVHTGHVRFFEEAAEHGDLYVCAGHDKNIELLKGKGHPLFPQNERQYIVQSIRFVKQALISSGDGWLDAEPEMRQLRPDKYVVNEDGDKPEKKNYCQANGIEYIVLKRLPKPGLTQRTSTNLRGF